MHTILLFLLSDFCSFVVTHFAFTYRPHTIWFLFLFKPLTFKEIQIRKQSIDYFWKRWQSRRILSLPCPTHIIRLYPHQCKYPRKQPKDCQNRLCTAKCKEEAISKRVGKVEMWLGTKLTQRTLCGSEGCHGHGKGRGTDSHTRHPGMGNLHWEEKST